MSRPRTYSPADSAVVGRQIHRTQARAALQKWMIEYAVWLAKAGKRPKRPERLEVASTLRNKHRDRDTHPDELPAVTYSQIRWLEGREEFHALVDRCVEGGIEAAQAYLRAYYPMLAEAHIWAVNHAMEKGDHRAMAALTVPPMDRFEPRKTEAPMIPATVHIHLSSEQLQAVSQPKPTIEATALIQDAAGVWRWPDGTPVKELQRPNTDEPE